MNQEKERIQQFVENEGISNRKFSENCGLSSNFLSGENAAGTDKMRKIYLKYPQLNMDWVITGRGEMLYRERTNMIVGADIEPAKIAIDSLKDENTRLKDTVRDLQADLITCMKEKEKIVDEGFKKLTLSDPAGKKEKAE